MSYIHINLLHNFGNCVSYLNILITFRFLNQLIIYKIIYIYIHKNTHTYIYIVTYTFSYNLNP